MKLSDKKRHEDCRPEQAGGCSRRAFMTKTCLLGLSCAVPSVFSPALRCFASSQKTPLIAQVTGARPKASRKALELLGGMGQFVKKGNRVVLKPNFSWASTPEQAADTHPDVVVAVARRCLEAGAREVLVLDHTINRAETCLRLSGIADACSGIKNVHVFAVNEERFYRSVAVQNGKVLKEVQIIKDVLDADVFINMPTAKSHTTTGVTLGMKNLMGIIWDRKYFHAKVDINQAIADLTSATKIHLTVLDASRAMVTAGPSGPGKVVYPDTIIAGTDPVAVDSVGVTLAQWYGQPFSPKQVKHIAAAHKMGLGVIDTGAMNIAKASV